MFLGAGMGVIVEFARAARSYQAAEPGSTRELLINAAERLFAERGIEGASLRMISAEAGQGNTRALQYHFDDRSGVVSAIMLTRLGMIEARRKVLLDAALADNPRPDVRTLLDTLFRPLSEMLDDRGVNVFARFLSQVVTNTHWWNSRAPLGGQGEASSPTATERSLLLLGQLLPHLNHDELAARLSHLLRMFVGAIIDRENALLGGGRAPSLARMIEEQLQMAAAAVSAPRAGKR